jgi:hypothetical protein
MTSRTRQLGQFPLVLALLVACACLSPALASAQDFNLDGAMDTVVSTATLTQDSIFAGAESTEPGEASAPAWAPGGCLG